MFDNRWYRPWQDDCVIHIFLQYYTKTKEVILKDCAMKCYTVMNRILPPVGFIIKTQTLPCQTWKVDSHTSCNFSLNPMLVYQHPCSKLKLKELHFFFFFFLILGFTALSRIFHLYRANHSSKVGKNRRTRGKTTWPSVRRTWLFHMWPKQGLKYSSEKSYGLRVNSPIH